MQTQNKNNPETALVVWPKERFKKEFLSVVEFKRGKRNAKQTKNSKSNNH
jgi:hypothetical protein